MILSRSPIIPDHCVFQKMALPAVFPLLPTADQNHYLTLVTASAPAEGLVNGIWNSILSARFPTGQLAWTINPEYGIVGGFPDFLIIRQRFAPNHGQAWTIIFEGKSSTGDNYEHILTQLVGYTASLANGQFTYLIGARGRTCGFWRYTKGNAHPDQQMSSDGAGHVYFKDLSAVAQYDIVTQQGQISDMLQWIINHSPPFV